MHKENINSFRKWVLEKQLSFSIILLYDTFYIISFSSSFISFSIILLIHCENVNYFFNQVH